MPTPDHPPAPQVAGDAHPASPAATSGAERHFGDILHSFWAKNSQAILIALLVVLVAIIAKGVWEYLQEQREREIGRDYSAASSQLQLKAFAAAHPRHPLGAAALLRVADEAYRDVKYADAIAPYDQAAAILKTGPLASRARLGSAMAKLQAGRMSEGEAALKAFASDPKEIKGFRAEAAYHLVTNSLANQKAEDVKTYSDLVLQIDPASPWAQRVIALRALLPASESAIKLPVTK